MGFWIKWTPNIDITGYDIVKELTEVDAWNLLAFEVVVSSEVFCQFNAEQLERLLCEFKSHNKNMELVVGISRQSFINKVGSVPLGHDDAHDEVKACRRKKRIVTLHGNYLPEDSSGIGWSLPVEVQEIGILRLRIMFISNAVPRGTLYHRVFQDLSWLAKSLFVDLN